MWACGSVQSFEEGRGLGMCQSAYGGKGREYFRIVLLGEKMEGLFPYPPKTVAVLLV